MGELNRQNCNPRLSISYTLQSARLAPVGFLFDRKGYVKVAAKSPASLEPIIEVGLDAGADDFSESEPSEDGQEIEVIVVLRVRAFF